MARTAAILVCGTTGENPTHTEEEHNKLTELTAKRCGDVVCADDGRKDSHQIAGSGQAVGTKIAAEFPPVGRKDRRGGGHAASIRGIGAILGL